MKDERMVKTKECIHCMFMWDCKGKPKNRESEPCLYYKEDPNNPELKGAENE